jgi:hypothetical protein
MQQTYDVDSEHVRMTSDQRKWWIDNVLSLQEYTDVNINTVELKINIILNISIKNATNLRCGLRTRTNDVALTVMVNG